MHKNMVNTLWAVRCLHKVSGYNPKAGEVAKVAGISRATAYRHLLFLVESEMVELIEMETGSEKYRFRESVLGMDFLSISGRV